VIALHQPIIRYSGVYIWGNNTQRHWQFRFFSLGWWQQQQQLALAAGGKQEEKNLFDGGQTFANIDYHKHGQTSLPDQCMDDFLFIGLIAIITLISGRQS
jgi:hypothetical protein